MPDDTLTVTFPESLPAYPEQIAEWLRVFVGQDQVTELRAIGKAKNIDAGFYRYDGLDSMARESIALSKSGNYKGIYFIFNPIDPALFYQAPYRVINIGRRVSKDVNILNRKWLLVDADPVRNGDCSATDEEKSLAKLKLLDVRCFLKAKNWPDPIWADSGNGYHLLYRIDLPAEDGGIVKRILHVLAAQFDDHNGCVDKTVQ